MKGLAAREEFIRFQNRRAGPHTARTGPGANAISRTLLISLILNGKPLTFKYTIVVILLKV